MTEPSTRGRVAATLRTLRTRAVRGWTSIRTVRAWATIRRSPAARRWLGGLLVAVVALTGSVLGLLPGARPLADVGPLQPAFRLTPPRTGDPSAYLPPPGAPHPHTH